MKLVLIPPYRGAGYDFKPEEEPYYRRVLDLLVQSGQLEGVQVDIDGGLHTDHVSASRDQALFDHLAVAVQSRVRDLAASGDYDAMVVLGGIDVGFDAVRAISPVPIAYPVHSSLHVASLIADRFSYIDVSDPQAARVRRLARGYGFDGKLVSVRNFGRTSTDTSPILRDVNMGDGLSPETSALLDQVVEQCVAAIEHDEAEALIVSFTPLQVLQPDIRRRIDEAGYAEVPIVWLLSAAIAMATSLARMQLNPAARAFPTDALRAKPSRR